MKKSVILISLVIFASCSSKDEQFCECLNAGEELNNASAKMLTGEVTKEDAAALKKLKDKKKKACVNYQTMNGDEMLKRKEKCK